MARLEIKKISYGDVKPFILNIHYARRMPCVQHAYGGFIGDVMVAVVTYGQPASPPLCKGIAGERNRKHVLELNRLVVLPQYNGGNIASQLVSGTLRMLPTRTFVVSYADTGWGHVGYVYQATNWLYTGLTRPRTDKYSESGHARHYKVGEQRRQYRSAKHRYVYLVGTRRERKEMRKELRYPVFDNYPKGESKHYSTENPIPVISAVRRTNNESD